MHVANILHVHQIYPCTEITSIGKSCMSVEILSFLCDTFGYLYKTHHQGHASQRGQLSDLDVTEHVREVTVPGRSVHQPGFTVRQHKFTDMSTWVHRQTTWVYRYVNMCSQTDNMGSQTDGFTTVWN